MRTIIYSNSALCIGIKLPVHICCSIHNVRRGLWCMGQQKLQSAQ